MFVSKIQEIMSLHSASARLPCRWFLTRVSYQSAVKMDLVPLQSS
jgi:hypothetical protein